MSLMDESFPYDVYFNFKLEENDVEFDNNSVKGNMNVNKKIKTSTSELSSKNFRKLDSISSTHKKHFNTKYKHIPSKVRQYISEMEAMNKKNICQKTSSRLTRFNSLPTNNLFEKENCFEFDREKFPQQQTEIHSNESTYKKSQISSIDVNENNLKKESFLDSQVFYEKTLEEANNIIKKLNDEKEFLKSMNEYLQTNLDNKVAQVAKLKRNNDFLQRDNIDLHEKLSKYNQKTNIETFNLRLRSSSNDMKKEMSSNIFGQTSILPHTNNKSDSAIESDSDTDVIQSQLSTNSNSLELFNFIKSPKIKLKANSQEKKMKINAKKKRKLFKKSVLKKILGPCGNCRSEKENLNDREKIFYEEINITSSFRNTTN